MKSERALSHCALEVRRYDYDRYLCAMFANTAARNRLIALYAFNLELARIAESVREPVLGEIRLQWWRDTVDGVYRNEPREHPVAKALTETGAARRLSRPSIEQLIDTRARDLDETPMPDRAALVRYAEGTSSTLLSLALDLLEIHDTGARTAAHHLGRAWALMGIIRATAHLGRHGRTLLPADLLARHGATNGEILQGTASEALRLTISEVAKWAQRDLDIARTARAPRAAMPVMLIGPLARAYLNRLRRAKFNPYDDRLAMSPLARQLSLLGHAIGNRP